MTITEIEFFFAMNQKHSHEFHSFCIINIKLISDKDIFWTVADDAFDFDKKRDFELKHSMESTDRRATLD